MTVKIITGDCRDVLAAMPDGSTQCCVTSPPYFGLRDYGNAAQIGLETTPDAYVAEMVAVFREVRRVLRDDGTVWLNLGDSYAANRSYQVEQTKGGPKHGAAQSVGGRRQNAADYSLKPKDLIGIPWRVAFALQADGWWLRQDIIWSKLNPMPESVTDRCTKAHEYVFLLSKSDRYFYDAKAIAEPAKYPGDQGFLRGAIDGCDSYHVAWRAKSQQKRKMAGIDSKSAGGDTRNRRSVWPIPSRPYSGAHFATMPPALAELCIRAGSRPGDAIIDPFGGAGTTGLVADRLGRDATLIELNPAYAALARERINGDAGIFAPVATEGAA